MSDASASPVEQRSWFRRNLIWLIPVGCLLPIVLCGGMVGGILLVVMGFLKSSGPYQDGLAKAKASPAVQKALGAPVEPGFFVTGNLNTQIDTGTADISIAIKGSKGTGTVHVIGTMAQNKWTYAKMDVVVDGSGEVLNLLED